MKPYRWRAACTAAVLLALTAPVTAQIVSFHADLDSDLDLADAQVFLNCFGAMNCPEAPNSLDLGTNGIGLEDWQGFVNCMTSPDDPQAAGCMFDVIPTVPATIEDGQAAPLDVQVLWPVGPVNVLWRVLSGSATISDEETTAATLVATGQGQVLVRLTVEDALSQFTQDFTIDVTEEGFTEFFVRAGLDRTIPVGSPTVIDLVGSYFDPDPCSPGQYIWEWALLSAPEGATGFFDNPFRLGDTSPVHYTLNNNVEGVYVFQLWGLHACGTQVEDVDAVAIQIGDEPPEFTVLLTCPQEMDEDGEAQLSALVSGATGELTYEWTVDTNGIITVDPLDGRFATLESTGAGPSLVELTVIDDMGTGVTEDDEDKTDSCTITKVINPLSCDVGSDGFFVNDLATDPPLGFDFSDFIYSFGEAPFLEQNAIPVPFMGDADDSEGTAEDLLLYWNVVDVPDQMVPGDVIITSDSGVPPPLDLDFLIVPDDLVVLTRLTPSGLIGDPLQSAVQPGAYTFELQAWRSDFSLMTACEVTITVEDRFHIDPDGLPAFSGVAPAHAEPTHLTLPPEGIMKDFRVRSFLTGVLRWELDDLDTPSYEEILVTSSPVVVTETGNTLNVPLQVSIGDLSSIGGGAFHLFGDFIADIAEAEALDQPTAVHAYFQPDLFPGLTTLNSVELMPGQPSAGELHYGLVSSDDEKVAIHGAHAGTDTYDGHQIRLCDYDCDQIMDVLILDEERNRIRVCSGLAEDPDWDDDATQYLNAIVNSLNNDGSIDADFEQFDIFLGSTVATDFACVDLDDNGHPDLAIGEALYDGDAGQSLDGRVRLYYHGGPTQCSFGYRPWPPTPSTTFRRENSGSANLDFLFGWRLGAGDFNGDGIEDLIVTSPGDNGDDDTESGRIFVIPGSTTRYDELEYTIYDAPMDPGLPDAQVIGEFDGSHAGDLFGFSLDVADVDTDGFADLVVGSPGFDGSGIGTPDDAGAVYVVRGRNTPTFITGFDYDYRYEGDQAGLGFGRHVAVCNFDGTGIPDYAVTTYGASAGALDPNTNDARGGVFVLQDMPAEFASDSGMLATFPQVMGTNGDSNLGDGLATGDFNQDGLDDILTKATSSGFSPVLDDQKVFLYLGDGLVNLDADLVIENGNDEEWLDYLPSHTLSGTVSSSSNVLTGSGTDFLNQLRVGNLVHKADGTQTRVITAIHSTTEATLNAPFLPPLPAGTTLNIVETVPVTGVGQGPLRSRQNWLGIVDLNADGLNDIAFSESMFDDQVSVIYARQEEAP